MFWSMKARENGVKYSVFDTFNSKPFNQGLMQPVLSDHLRPRGLYSPWNSPGQNTGVSSHILVLAGNHPNPRIEPRSPVLQADFLPVEPPGKPQPRSNAQL